MMSLSSLLAVPELCYQDAVVCDGQNIEIISPLVVVQPITVNVTNFRVSPGSVFTLPSGSLINIQRSLHSLLLIESRPTPFLFLTESISIEGSSSLVLEPGTSLTASGNFLHQSFTSIVSLFCPSCIHLQVGSLVMNDATLDLTPESNLTISGCIELHNSSVVLTLTNEPSVNEIPIIQGLSDSCVATFDGAQVEVRVPGGSVCNEEIKQSVYLFSSSHVLAYQLLVGYGHPLLWPSL